MARKLEDIFDECVGRLASGAGIDECVESYPEHREELVPLLEVVAATMEAASAVSYRPEAKARGLSRLTSALAQEGLPRKRRWFTWPTLQRRLPAPLIVGVVAALLTTGMAVGTGVASSDSVPGEPLYWVKTQKENISLMMPRSDMTRAEAHARLARERVQEMGKLADRGNLDKAEQLVKVLQHHLNMSSGYARVVTAAHPVEMPARPTRTVHSRDTDRLKKRLQEDMNQLRSRLNQVFQTASPAQRQRVIQLRRHSELRYFTLIAALEGRPSPPSQARPTRERPPPKR